MLQKSSVWKTASVFFLNPTKKHYLKEISREISLAHTSVKNNIMDLIKEGIIKQEIEQRGSRRFPMYSADLRNPSYKKYKQVFNLMSIMESGLIEHIGDKLMPKAIVLFGSYRKGEDIEDSDIDLFVECREADIDLDGYRKKLRRQIQLHFNEDFHTYPKELRNNILNGVVLHGFLEGIR
ncbi:MAG: nucleotidyltransferase domain-containing protein [Nanoarchaeota archaeon]|nr:nucleotidyltransferase domain-containing protein [Nanoarchaeota archaeon]